MELPWGIHSIPKESWINPDKQYTANGFQVLNLKIVLHDSRGEENAFPVKGTLLLSKSNKTKRTRLDAWTLNGKNSIFGDSIWDLKEII